MRHATRGPSAFSTPSMRSEVAVRPGDVAVAVAPEPMSMILFGVGGVVMAARRKLLKTAA